MATTNDPTADAADDVPFTSQGTASFAPLQSSTTQTVFYFTDELYGLASLAMHRLKVTRFQDANDPFELRALRVSDRKALDEVKRTRKRYMTTRGMLCFSKCYDDPVMWSHYANRHRGICLAFEVPRKKLICVTYDGERYAAQLEQATEDSPAVLDAASRDAIRRSKFKNWTYESEVRWIIQLSRTAKEAGMHFYRFGRDLELRHVLLGERCSLNQASFVALVEKLFPSASVWKAALNLKSFKVNPGECLRHGDDALKHSGRDRRAVAS